MAGAGDVIAAIDKFELNLIEKQWSDEIWSSEFTSCPDYISEEFADKFSPLSYCDIVQVIEQADKIINLWLNDCIDSASISSSDLSNSSSCVGPSWTLLQDIDYKRLLSLLYFYTCKGQLNNQDINSVYICMKATNFYFTLLIIPGSDIYKIFHLSLFEKCLETLALHKYLEIATGRKIKKPKGSKKSEDLSSDDEFLEMDETLTLSQQQNVVKQLNFLLSTFQQFVKKFSFKKYPEALNMSLAVLADLTRIERNCSLQEFSTTNTSTSFAPLSRNAYLTMKDLCSSLHGRTSEIIRLVLFYIMPNLTLIGGLANPEMNKLNQKELTNIRNIAVSFIIENIIPLGEDAHLGLKILIQQLCYNMIDRADYRSKATDMVLAILCKLPTNLYYNLLKWIFRMSMMEGAHHRVISLELLSKLIFIKLRSEEISKLAESQYQTLSSQSQQLENAMLSKSELHKTDGPSSISQEPIVSFAHSLNYVPLEFRKIMLAIIIDRIRDEAAIVRTRALSVLSDIISNKTYQPLQQILNDLFVDPYSEILKIDLQNCENENEFLKWKTFVSFLDKVQDSTDIKSIYPGAKVIVSKVFEKCLDERVNVRKAALQVITNLFKFSSKWMTNETLSLFGKHCRDPALSIRKEMLIALTDLMLHFPDSDALMELWVDEVVPLIMDREIKVQEQALQIFTNTILSKIMAFNKLKNRLDEVPWKLLDKIGKQNKKSFLMTACALWSESGNFNQAIITTLSSYVGTVYNGPAWIFLACISEYFDIGKPDFVMDYYVNVVAEGTGDRYSSYFALLTLSNSWQKLPKEKKEALQMSMFNKLKSFSVEPTFVGLTVEIVAGITVLIAEDEMAGKKEIAKWGMEMMHECEVHLEVCLKTTKDKSPECKNCINILALLGALVLVCPDKIKHTTFLLLYNFLMQSSSGGSAYDRKMRAITVITVSKMALQNDHFARNLVAGLAQLLVHSSDPVVLNNVIVAIADIGESYASLIEPLIPFICVCLKSKHKSLKEITLVLLIELLQEDYLKARGALIYHLLTMINEPNPWLVNIVKFYFTNSLLARNPYKMYHLLLPGMFHLNQYTSHPDYPRMETTDAEWQIFDLSGPSNHAQRMTIYKFMLSNIPDMVKMKCLHFICTVVLNGVADNIISIKSKNGEQLLFDAFCILLTREIKIEYNDLVKKKNEDGEEEDDQKQNPLYKLGKQMFTAAQKKEIIETIVPICCKLKKKLLIENKKLLPYLHKFVRELVKDYKSEINEIFKEDKQFGIEILHELDKINNEEAEEEENENSLVSEENLCLEKTRVETIMTAIRKENSHKRSTKSLGNLSAIPEQNLINEKNTEQSNCNEEKNSPSTNLNLEPRVVLEKLNASMISSGDHSTSQIKEDEIDLKINKNQSEDFDKRESLTGIQKSILDKQPLVVIEKISLAHIEKCSDVSEKDVESDKSNNEIKSQNNVANERCHSKRLKQTEKESCGKIRNEKEGMTPILGDKACMLKKKLLKKKQEIEKKNMEEAINNIIIPPPPKNSVKIKKLNSSSGNSCYNKTPSTPIVDEKKELLTSTPLVALGNPNFEMDISSVVDETS